MKTVDAYQKHPHATASKSSSNLNYFQSHTLDIPLVMIVMIIPMKNHRYVRQNNVRRDNSSVEINSVYRMKLSAMAWEIVLMEAMNQLVAVRKDLSRWKISNELILLE